MKKRSSKSWRRSLENDLQDQLKRDLKKIKDQALRERVKNLIGDVKQAASLDQLPQLKKISGSDDLYRIRLGDYRVGIAVRGDKVDFVRVGHRRDIYRGFP